MASERHPEFMDLHMIMLQQIPHTIDLICFGLLQTYTLREVKDLLKLSVSLHIKTQAFISEHVKNSTPAVPPYVAFHSANKEGTNGPEDVLEDLEKMDSVEVPPPFADSMHTPSN